MRALRNSAGHIRVTTSLGRFTEVPDLPATATGAMVLYLPFSESLLG